MKRRKKKPPRSGWGRIPMEVANELADARRKAGLTVRDLSILSQISILRIRNIESSFVNANSKLKKDIEVLSKFILIYPDGLLIQCGIVSSSLVSLLQGVIGKYGPSGLKDLEEALRKSLDSQPRQD